MIFFLLSVVILISIFIAIDLSLVNICGKYYFIHSICNFFIVLITAPDVFNLYLNPYSTMEISLSIYASIIVYALHIYHILWYFNKLRIDDWLHHILMIFIALPIANYFGSVRLLGHSLFYTTGLPGMIDYMILFLVKNNFVDRITQKRINLYLNCYLRNPGCTIHSFITLINTLLVTNYFDIILNITTAILVYWNGIYFMEQVVGNYHIESTKLKI